MYTKSTYVQYVYKWITFFIIYSASSLFRSSPYSAVLDVKSGCQVGLKLGCEVGLKLGCQVGLGWAVR